MSERPERVVALHLTLGVAARGTAVVTGAVRLTLVPLRPLVRGVAGAPPLAPLRRFASERVAMLASSGAEVEHDMIDTGDRVARKAIASPRFDDLAAAIVERALTSPATELLISRTLERPELERLIVLALDSPATDRIVRSVLAAPGVELAITRVLESELLDATTARFLESEEIERVIERIAHGPELRAAVAAQSAGLADMVAEEIRGRSVAADDTAERLARSLVPRRWRHGPPAGAAGT